MPKQEKLTGRRLEQEVLETCFESDRPEFIAIYGRRRVGKTFLIRTFFSKKKCRFFNVTGIYQAPLKQQLKEFFKAVAQTFFRGAELKEPTNWFDAFEFLTKTINSQLSKKEKIVLFFDEFPWMATPRSKLLQALEYYWNQYWSQDQRIKLIICGSAASWIIGKIINNKGGLHNRLTRTILLDPMTLLETKLMLRDRGIKLNNKHITNLYMVTGGVPYYLAQFPKGLSDTQIIEKLAFSKNSLFLEEFSKLYSALFHDAETSISIIRTIASHRYGIQQTELFEVLKKMSKGGSSIKKLKELEDAGFIISFKPFKHKKKGLFYKVIDEYSLFYFHWIEPIKETLQKKGLRGGYWDKKKSAGSWFSWAGYAFEAICYKHLNQISEALNLSPTALASTWQSFGKKGEDGAQIDLLFDRDDDAITICEIKFTNSPFAIDKEYARKLNRKLVVFSDKTKTEKQLFLSMISASGLKETMYSEELVDSFITLNDLFRE